MMDVEEFYKIQAGTGCTCYKDKNLSLILEKINAGELKPPVTTYNNFYYNIGVQPIQKSKLRINTINGTDKKTNETRFSKKAVFGINQCIVNYKGLILKEKRNNKEF